jgi:hypothetical protein
LDNALVNFIYKYANRKWYNEPLTDGRKLQEQEYLSIWEQVKRKKWPIVDELEQKSGFAIDHDWLHELALTTQVVNKKSEINYQHGRILYSMLRKYLENTQTDYVNILESGTARGFSSLCMAKAIKDHQIAGKIVTFDVLPHNQKMYWNCIADYSGKKTRKELLHNYSDLCEKFIIFHQGNTYTEGKKIDLGRLHFAFLDAGHDFYHVINEIQFPGVVKAVDYICENSGYQKNIIQLSESRLFAIALKK